MIQIRPVSQLRNNFPAIEKVVKGGEPVYLTKNGYGSMVVLSLEQYAELTGDIELKLDESDLDAAWRHIALKLLNPEAADRLVFDTEAAILKRLGAPEAFEARHSGREREHPYYRLQVRNFTVYL